MNYLIGLDIGTTNIKALVIDHTGKQVAFAKRTSPFAAFGIHQAYFAESFWQNISTLLAEAIANMRLQGADSSCIRGLAVSSMGEMGFPMGKDGALYPAISWYDQCSVPYVEQLKKIIPLEKQIDLLGQKLLHIFTVSKIMWLKSEHPQIYEDMETWLCMADYVAYKLCGSRCMDYSLAARTGMLDYEKRCWSDSVINKAGLDAEKLPRLVQSGDLLGYLKSDVATTTGIPEGTPIFAGGHDHVCESFACGGGAPGILLDSSGTTEVMVCAETDKQKLMFAGREGFNIGPHVRRDMYYIMGGMLASGASVDWFRRELGCSSAELREVGSLTFLPHLRGSSSPTRDPQSKGAFLGLTDQNSASDLMQAVYEGLAFELRTIEEEVTGGTKPQRVIGVGGGYLNDGWAQIKADVLGVEIEVPVIQEATAMGAALLAGVGSGVFANADEAFKTTFKCGKRFSPTRKLEAYYQEKFLIYRSLYQTLSSTNAALSRL